MVLDRSFSRFLAANGDENPLKERSKTKLRGQNQDADCHGLNTSLKDTFACSGKIASASVCPLQPETRLLEAHFCWFGDPKGPKKGPKTSPSLSYHSRDRFFHGGKLDLLILQQLYLSQYWTSVGQTNYETIDDNPGNCLLYTSPSPRD